jgi:hypothetical protein
MKQSQHRLLLLADKMGSKYNDSGFDRLENKYADLTTWLNGNPPISASFVRDQAQSNIQSAVLNAASNPANGIINFPKMLQDGNETLALNVVRSGDKVLVSVPTVSPPTEANKYFPLRQQIQTYLQNNLQLFPELHDKRPVEYNNFTITLNY